MHKISVIICCYTKERLEDIFNAVESVLTQTSKPHEVIISVDNNMELFNLLRSQLPSEIKIVINNGTRGLSETRNVGIRAADGNLVAFLDDDAIAESEWLYYLKKWFEQPDVAAIGGKAIPTWPDNKRPSWFPEELDWIVGCTYRGLPTKGNNTRNVIGCNMAFRKDILEQVGYFRSEMGRTGTTVGCGEESELCLRINHTFPEMRILYEKDAVIHHQVTPSRIGIKYLIRRAYNEGLYKRIIEKLTKSISEDILSTENSYLRFLLFRAIPRRLKHVCKKGSISQTAAILCTIVATGMGYVSGIIKN